MVLGTPISVERSINDVIPIDNALNESMLNPSILENEENTPNDENYDETDEIAIDKGDEIANNNEDEIVDIKTNGNNEKEDSTDEHSKGNETTQEIRNDNKQVRKSERIRKQRYEIHPDDIGNNDDEKDKTYKR